MSTIVLVLPLAQVTVDQGRAVATASVTNMGPATESVVLGVFPPLAAGGATAPSAVPWTTVERPQRDLAPQLTEQFTVTFAPPEGTAPGTYATRFIAYSAYGAPEESADQARQLEVVLPAAPVVVPPAKTPWWIYAVAAALVLVVGVVAFLLLRPEPPCPDGNCPSPSPSPSPTPVVIEDITWVVTDIRQGDAVTVPLVKNLTLRVQGGAVTGSDGCNRYNGTWTQSGDTVAVSNLLTTQKFCFPPQVNEQAALFRNVLAGTRRLALNGPTLELSTDDDRALRLTKS